MMEKYNLLKRLDKHLLINYPDVWATRVHWVIALAGPIYLLSGLALGIIPFSLVQFSQTKAFVTGSFIFSIFPLLYYAYQQKLFRPAKEYGFRGKFQILCSYRNFAIIYLSIATIALFPYFLSQIWLARMAHYVSTETLVHDVNLPTLLIVCFYLSFALFIFNHTSIRNLFTGLSVMAIAIAIFILASIDNSDNPEIDGIILSFYVIICWIGVIIFTKRICKLTTYKAWYEIALLCIAQVSFLFIPCVIGASTSDTFLLVHSCFIAFCLIPSLELLFIRLKSLPEK